MYGSADVVKRKTGLQIFIAVSAAIISRRKYMFCNKCGRRIEKEEKICPECGAKVEKTEYCGGFWGW